MDTPAAGAIEDFREAYDARMAALREDFAATRDGVEACRSRSRAVDDLLLAVWQRKALSEHEAVTGVTLVAIGGYGRQQLFPFSDIDLLFLTEKPASPAQKSVIRSFSQALWDCGLKLAAVTRSLGECGPFKASDPEGSLALQDMRLVTGEDSLFQALQKRVLQRRSAREARALTSAVAELTRERHARFGDTLFHLEPNVKDAPGGLRDVHVCQWLGRFHVTAGVAEPEPDAFTEATAFLAATRVFLHLRHGRDDNTLDWHAQDEAATQGIGLSPSASRTPPDPSTWMRAYFRHARAVERQLLRQLVASGEPPRPPQTALRAKMPARTGFTATSGVLEFKAPQAQFDAAREPETVLDAFALVSATGLRVSPASEQRIAAALPYLSASLEDGPRLWTAFQPILLGPYAAQALREMHALGLLELILPEFHGIDALVIRDAYHRYTVDEHTFVLLGVLHGLEADPPAGAPEWRHRFRLTLRELAHPELLYLAALLHDTGKGRAGQDHAATSAQLASSVCARLEFGAHETGLVLRLIELHLEMSAALRRDVFDTETVRSFAEKVGTHELLRMLTLFTYADISAVHPDALTPWKAENLWRLFMAAANQLDRSVDQDRLDTHREGGPSVVEALLRAMGRQAPARAALETYLDGFPERYLRTRSPEAIRQHMGMASNSGLGAVTLGRSGALEELTVVTRDRPRLFSDLTAVLAGWGMEVFTAEAFSNASGLIVDTFRFQDAYQTLELNPEERDRLRLELGHVLTGESQVLATRRRRRSPTVIRREITTRVDFDDTVSTHSTLLQVVARNVPGLLHTAAEVLSDFGCSVEVALIDTEGELAIDVFYLTRNGSKLQPAERDILRRSLLDALGKNALPEG